MCIVQKSFIDLFYQVTLLPHLVLSFDGRHLVYPIGWTLSVSFKDLRIPPLRVDWRHEDFVRSPSPSLKETFHLNYLIHSVEPQYSSLNLYTTFSNPNLIVLDIFCDSFPPLYDNDYDFCHSTSPFLLTGSKWYTESTFITIQ